jgi:hypothetical protein
MVRGQFAEARKLLDDAHRDSVRHALIGMLFVNGIGRVPIAEMRGFIDLLLRDEAAAVQDGHRVLEFAAHQEKTDWNRWFLRALEAEGLVLTGEHEQALEAAREAIQLAAQTKLPQQVAVAKSLAARVLAWGGAQDESARMLEDLSVATPGLAPAYITRDPIYNVPLADNPRYQALKAKLEAQMAATKLE